MKYVLKLSIMLFTSVFFWQFAFIQAQGRKPEITDIIWSPDGTMLAGGADGEVYVWTTDGELLLQIQGLEGQIQALDWSPNSSRLAIADKSKNVTIWNINASKYEAGELIAIFVGHQEIVMSVAWSPDGTRLATASREEEYVLRIWDVLTYQTESIAKQATSTVYDIDWSPDSTHIAIGTATGVLIFEATLNIMPFAVADEYRVGSPAHILSLDWNSDGTQILTTREDYNIAILDPKTGEELRLFSGHTDLIRSISWSPDNSEFISASQDHTVRLWNASTGDNVRTYRLPVESRGWSASWSPNGYFIAYAGNTHPQVQISPLAPTTDTVRAQFDECIQDTQDTDLLTSLNAKIDAEQWQAFINEVEAQRDKKITAECVDSLVEMAGFLLEQE
jgi:WD40 repeat protein